jgi:energy-converting hydrogenase Eha subunit E
MNSALGMGAGSGVDPNDPLVKEMTKEVSNAISMGFGAYLSALACLYFAGIAVKDYLAANKNAAQRA